MPTPAKTSKAKPPKPPMRKARIEVELYGIVEVELTSEELKRLRGTTDVPIDDVGLNWVDVLNRLDGTIALAE